MCSIVVKHDEGVFIAGLAIDFSISSRLLESSLCILDVVPLLRGVSFAAADSEA